MMLRYYLEDGLCILKLIYIKVKIDVLEDNKLFFMKVFVNNFVITKDKLVCIFMLY